MESAFVNPWLHDLASRQTQSSRGQLQREYRIGTIKNINQIRTKFLFNLVDDPNEKHNLYPTIINSSSNNKDIFKIVQKLQNKLYEYKNTMTIPWDGYSSKKNNINLKLSKNGLAQW